MPSWFSKRLILGVAGAVLIIATFAYFLPKIADYRDVWGVVQDVSWQWALALAVATVVNLATFAPPWLVLLPGLRFWPALMMTQATTALSIVVPGGAAVGIATSYGMLRRAGFERRAIARSVTLVSLWNQLANLAYPIVAVFLLTIAGEETTVLATVAFVGVAIFGVVVGALVLVLYSSRMASEIGDLAARGATRVKARFHREPVTWSGASFERFRVDVVEVIARRWHLLSLATLAGSLSVFVVLLVALRALQVPEAEVSAVEAFAAWSLARILGSIPITPGGIGVIELSLTAALIGFGGDNAGVVGAVLVYRFLTIVPSLVLGMVAAGVWRRLPGAPEPGAATVTHGTPRLSRRLVRALTRAVSTYTEIAGGQRAAAISYRVLFSLVPFVALLVSALELVLPEATQENVVSWLVGVASLPEELAESVDAAVEDAGPPASLTGAVALVALIWGASGMMASVRSAFRAVWGSEADRPYLRGKLLDVLLVFGAGLLVVAAFGLSLVVQVVTQASSEIATELGRGESATAGLGALAQLVGSLALAFVAFALLYRVVPPVPVRLRDVVPGAVVAAVGVHLASAGFSIYLNRFGGFNDVFGPLGAVLAFLLLVYVAAIVLLLGACVAAAWPETATEPTLEAGNDETLPLRSRLIRAARGLVVRDRS